MLSPRLFSLGFCLIVPLLPSERVNVLDSSVSKRVKLIEGNCLMSKPVLIERLGASFHLMPSRFNSNRDTLVESFQSNRFDRVVTTVFTISVHLVQQIRRPLRK